MNYRMWAKSISECVCQPKMSFWSVISRATKRQ